MFDAVFLDHGNPEAEYEFQKVSGRLPHIKRTRFFGNYLTSIHRAIWDRITEHIWVLNSVCNYNDFDFTWEPVPWEDKQIHVFCTDGQKFGDTFLIPKKEFSKQCILDNYAYDIISASIHDIALKKLEYFKDVNWHEEFQIPRHPMPIVRYGVNSSALETVKKHNCYLNSHYWCVNEEANVDYSMMNYNPSLWEKPKIHVFNQGGDVLLVPKATKRVISKQLSDYRDIQYHDQHISTPKPLDVVFISNGELTADKNLQLLCSVNPSCKHIEGINGRSAAYKAAAEASTTPWFFAVFAKCEIIPEFDFSFQPDVLRESCHYIFHAKNPVNGLEYGHQAVILYNKALVLATDEPGLDFTLSMPHTTVPELSCIARYNTDPYATWRTAFREVLKLKADNTIEGNIRLNTWTTYAEGMFAEWSLRGAQDATSYFNDVNGEHDKLMLSFEWDWLKEYYSEKY